MDTFKLSGLAKRFCEDQIISKELAHSATRGANEQGISLIQYLVNNQLASPQDIVVSASEEFGIPVFDLSSYNKDVIPKDIIKDTLIQKHNVLPLQRRGKTLFIAVSDPTNITALDEIKFTTGLTVEAVLSEADKLKSLIDGYLSSKDLSALGSNDGDDEFSDFELEPTEDEEQDVTQTEVDDAPVVKFINKMLLTAIKTGASDLHFEPYEKRYRVRFRTDGVLHEVSSPPNQIAGKISARLKVMSKMDIAERRVPQDGRIKLKISKTKSIDFRVNTLPCLFGEKIVLRILDSSSAQMGIDALGYEEDQKDMYMSALEQPQGMILVTGPTGSGKTVSLYTGLNILNTQERNISTAEDPVEINLEGINQCNVNNKVGLTFAEALRSFLRQDPDIIMVGEIRDLETAEIAIKAAQTGHMVMSTLHTNSAPETLTRMINMGVPAFNLATSVNLIIAQRLGRRLCSNCKTTLDVPKEVLLEEGFTEDDISTDFKLYQPVGCDKCNKGYKGRVGIYEVVKVTPLISKIIMEGGNSIQIAEACKKEGFDDLRRSSLKKVMQGVTSLEEANRVTSSH
ncbi:type IV-A pilus assembly ATPase PilB [Litoribrevibacter albus]|uniref:Type 4 fimbrial assembly protein PilB n=1 Tax=Litoribrevibacter albus TaxID=1473156 RepID=A0AA37W854_9GAMM|nr:type IV-A pilus assembly ATPase PilB [Litoribrevibacter albus]GLQ33372.1 type 4 fimbrial assembly protein PilB [Litoribrevibacter albus]